MAAQKAPTGKFIIGPRTNQPLAELKQFIGICAQARKEISPKALKRHVVNFIGELDQDSKDFLGEIARILGRPR